ncbi:hypothetical protein [Arsenophonus sp. ENCA]|uniref:hypothetical protein n=1 Tax=Arsenophonus sp. ENCA TaxID=1987579 RepID=UPI0025BE2454|nr:hypothetical protein [Arsenophonus sp. ENCA]
MIPSYSLAQVFGISISEQRKIYFNHRNTLISLLSNTLIIPSVKQDITDNRGTLTAVALSFPKKNITRYPRHLLRGDFVPDLKPNDRG